MAFLSQQYRIPTINLSEYEVPEEIRDLVPRSLCERLVVMPVSRAGSSLIVAVREPDEDVLAALREATGFTVEAVLASAADIRAAHARYWT